MIHFSDTTGSPAFARPGAPPTVGARAPFTLPERGDAADTGDYDLPGERQEDAAPGTELPPIADPILLALFSPSGPPPVQPALPAPESGAAASPLVGISTPAAHLSILTSLVPLGSGADVVIPSSAVSVPQPLTAASVSLGATSTALTDAAVRQAPDMARSPAAVDPFEPVQPKPIPHTPVSLVPIPAAPTSPTPIPQISRMNETLVVPIPPLATATADAEVIDGASATLPSHWQVAPGVTIAAIAPIPVQVAAPRPDPGVVAATTIALAFPDVLGERNASDQPTLSATAILGTAAPLAIAVAAGQPMLDLGRERWPQDMIAHIEQMRDAADAANTRIRLVPDALGSVDVDVRREGDTLHVRFSAEQPQTRALLADAQPRLAEAAEARGLRLGQSSVDAGTAGHGQPRQPAARPEPRRAPAARTVDAETPADDTRIA